MQIYLPIAEMPVNVLLFFAMGGAVGFLSGLFGVGGGFLLTPLLIFSGIPPAIAVGTEANQVVASSISGVVAYWRRNSVDFKMGLVLLSGGTMGAITGVYLFAYLRRMGQIDFLISVSYVVFLGVIGGLMLVESVRALRAAQHGGQVGLHRPGRHNWVHGLPFKVRFRRSKLYISVIPPLIIGYVVGVIAAIMGVGGGFIMVPAMIYILRMPTNIVIGTSLFQIVFVTALVTILHATENRSVDIVLALLLIAGGVIGAQFGARLSQRLRGEQLRALLALLVLLVGGRLGYELVTPPKDMFSIITIERAP